MSVERLLNVRERLGIDKLRSSMILAELNGTMCNAEEKDFDSDRLNLKIKNEFHHK